ncbi:hypothetical protein [Chitinilyticum piscinae]|uniref:Uncharacterized protein n=1 Tax=Chitinilyticum piscinae TaxID=2866724 RepID=A0A8J7KFA9_9NEIS|nr:hypothetical protein [Chitinilyticum piscinae]MBE9609999.1 hypothetical protein [Chitinilyticum piscinae]
MESILELEIWSRPGVQAPECFGKEIENGFARDFDCKAIKFYGLYWCFGRVDAEILKFCLEQGEVSIADLHAYCLTHEINVDSIDEEVAARFIDLSFGRCIGWLHVDVGSVLFCEMERVFEWVYDNQLVVVDPVCEACVLYP